MSARRARKAPNISKDKSFAVIETIQGDSNVLVELLPNIWLQPKKKNGKISVRESAKYYYPRRMPMQTTQQYMKFLKAAKLECMQPANDNKWDLLDCKVLKMRIESYAEAQDAEKLFSDYFNTTDAEAEMKKTLPPKRLRKNKAKALAAYESESEDETSDAKGSSSAKEIVCYDSVFKAVAAMQCDSSSDSEAVDEITALDTQNNRSTYIATASSLMPLGVSNVLQLVDPGFNNAMTGSDVLTEECDQQDIAGDIVQQPVIFEFVDQKQSTTCKDTCGCCQKILNKMDYFQKKMLKEMGRHRQETMRAIHLFSSRYNVLLESPEFQSLVPEEDLAKQALDEQFEDQFNRDFPNETSTQLVETNNALKTDREYRKRFIAKLKRKEKEPNEIKAVRQFLKALCAPSCLSELTWGGTLKKKSFSSLESLIDVIALIVEEQFPRCDAYKIIKQVVQQRTKSASESVGKNERQEADAEVNRHGIGIENDPQTSGIRNGTQISSMGPNSQLPEQV